MSKIIRWALLSITLLLSHESFALQCLNNASTGTDVNGRPMYWWGEKTQTSALDTTVAVPNTLPKNTVLWRSPNVSLKITCWADQPSSGEYVYIYLSPDDAGYTKLGPDLELGITMNGVDYYCDNGMEIYQGMCRKKLDWYVRGCGSSLGCVDNYYQSDLTISFFVSKRSAPSPGKGGNLSGVTGIYGAFQFDGVNGLNPKNSTFRMNVTGLNRLRYVACSSKLSISPSTINFGAANPNNAVTGKTIREVPFSITSSKTCNSIYGLNAVLKPIQATTPDNYAIIPNNNKSVSISLFSGKDQSAIPLNKEFVLVESSGDRVSVRNFLARLKWNTSKPTLGEFRAGATIDVFYK